MNQQRENKRKENALWFRRGLKNGIPIAMGYFAVAFTLGITAKNAGMTALQAAVMSVTMLASAGEFAALTVIGADSGLLLMVITTIVVNMRYLLMSTALSQKIDSKTGLLHRLLMSYGVTDEIFGVAVLAEGRLNPFYNYGMISIASPGWTLGTALGVIAGTILPARVSSAMSVALYGMFLAVIIPPARKERSIAVVVAGSMLASWLFSVLPVLSDISSGTRIIILTVLIAGIAAILRPVTEETRGGENV